MEIIGIIWGIIIGSVFTYKAISDKKSSKKKAYLVTQTFVINLNRSCLTM